MEKMKYIFFFFCISNINLEEQKNSNTPDISSIDYKNVKKD